MADGRATVDERVAGVADYVRRLVYRMTAGRSVDREEALQSAMTAVVAAAKVFDPDGPAKFSTIAYTKAHFAVCDLFARTARERAEAKAFRLAMAPLLEVIDAGNPFDESLEERAQRLKRETRNVAATTVLALLESPRTPEELFIDAERRALIQSRAAAAFAAMDPLDREVVWACRAEDQSVAEAARQRGIKEDDARWRVRRAMAALERALRGVVEEVG